MEMNRNYKRVYVAGPLRGNLIKKRINIYRAKKTATWLWKRGMAVYCPHANSGWVDWIETDGFVIPANLDFMYSCDIILIVGKWYNSKGTVEEMKKAYESGMVIYFNKELLYQDMLKEL